MSEYLDIIIVGVIVIVALTYLIRVFYIKREKGGSCGSCKNFE